MAGSRSWTGSRNLFRPQPSITFSSISLKGGSKMDASNTALTEFSLCQLPGKAYDKDLLTTIVSCLPASISLDRFGKTKPESGAFLDIILKETVLFAEGGMLIVRFQFSPFMQPPNFAAIHRALVHGRNRPAPAPPRTQHHPIPTSHATSQSSPISSPSPQADSRATSAPWRSRAAAARASR